MVLVVEKKLVEKFKPGCLTELRVLSLSLKIITKRLLQKCSNKQCTFRLVLMISNKLPLILVAFLQQFLIR